MPKEKWMINPAELDEFQRGIRGLSIKDSYIVKGCAGSGKTILALLRANDIRIQWLAENDGAKPSFTLVVYTKTLKEFIRSAIKDMGIDLKQVINSDKWDADPVDYIVVDEAQDFTREEMEYFKNAKNISIMLYGDDNQQIYDELKKGGVLTIDEIATFFGLPIKELTLNYRLPKQIASFASHLSSDSNLENRCVKLGAEKPILRKFKYWEEELDFIIEEIGTRNYTDTGILLPFNDKKSAPYNNYHRNVESVKEYFDKKGFRHEYKMRTSDTDTSDLDFDSELPKVITYHSSKGLQFESVFIPFCDYPNHDAWFSKRFKNPLYVAMTRTYRNLYISHTSHLSPFLNGIPSNKMTKY